MLIQEYVVLGETTLTQKVIDIFNINNKG